VKRLVFALLGAACGGDHDQTAVTPPTHEAVAPGPPGAAVPATRDTVDTDRGFVGVIAASESADVVPRFAGVLAAVHVRPGDRVVAGQVLAEIDPRPVAEEVRAAEAAARRAQAEVRKARVDVEDARRKLALQKRATDSGVSPLASLDEARLALKRAQAAEQSAVQEAKVARSRANTERSHLAQTRLAAPFDGTVALRFRDAGATVEAGTPIVKVVKLGQLRLRFAVPPQRARELKPGALVTAAVETVASPMAAAVRHVSPALDPASELIVVEAELAVSAEAAADLRPGLAAVVRPARTANQQTGTRVR
jgi:RND family efflux transporter MFP subunit